MRAVREPVFLALLGVLSLGKFSPKPLKFFFLFLELCSDFVCTFTVCESRLRPCQRQPSAALLKLAFKHVNACLSVQYLIFESALPAVVRRYGRASVYGKA